MERTHLYLLVTCILFFPQRIFAAPLISELHPAPSTGESEWIELYNPDSTPTNLSGLQLYDQLSSPSLLHTFGESDTLAPGGYLQILLGSAKLNNSADGVTLKGPDGNTLDAVSYTSSETGKSWQRVTVATTELALTAPTPGAASSQYPLTTATASPTPTPSPSPTPTPTTTPLATPVPTPSATPQPTPSLTPQLTPPTLDLSHIQLSEIMACPQSGQEWIELYFSGSQSLTLENWRLTDSSGNLKLLSATLQPHSYTQLSWSGTLLNNAGDSLTLETPDEQLVISTSFTDCETGQSLVYAQTESATSSTGTWQPSSPSPGAANPSLLATSTLTTGTASLKTTASTAAQSSTTGTPNTTTATVHSVTNPLFSSSSTPVALTSPHTSLSNTNPLWQQYSLESLNDSLFSLQTATQSAYPSSDLNQSPTATTNTPSHNRASSSVAPSTTPKNIISPDTTTQSPPLPPTHAILAGTLFSLSSVATTLYAYPSLLQLILAKVPGLAHFLGST